MKSQAKRKRELAKLDKRQAKVYVFDPDGTLRPHPPCT